MISVPEKSMPPFEKGTLTSINRRLEPPLDKRTLNSLNRTREERSAAGGGRGAETAARPAATAPTAAAAPTVSSARPAVSAPSAPSVPVAPSAPVLRDMVFPPLLHLLKKGQKTAVDPQNTGIRRIRACFGWNVADARCDIDVSAFLLGAEGRVPGDEWFVFYGQETSPDGAVTFLTDSSGRDREILDLDLERLSPAVQKIVFVMTINEAFEKNLNFSMIREAYIRLTEGDREMVSYKPEEYFPGVTSMTIGELYRHNGQWKFNPVGQGVHQDLAGQCAIYGVEIAE